MDEIEKAVQSAYCFSGLRPPNFAAYIGSRAQEKEIWHYYKDKEGNYWAKSERSLKFEKEMARLQKKRAKKP